MSCWFFLIKLIFVKFAEHSAILPTIRPQIHSCRIFVFGRMFGDFKTPNVRFWPKLKNPGLVNHCFLLLWLLPWEGGREGGWITGLILGGLHVVGNFSLPVSFNSLSNTSSQRFVWIPCLATLSCGQTQNMCNLWINYMICCLHYLCCLHLSLWCICITKNNGPHEI